MRTIMLNLREDEVLAVIDALDLQRAELDPFVPANGPRAGHLKDLADFLQELLHPETFPDGHPAQVRARALQPQPEAARLYSWLQLIDEVAMDHDGETTAGKLGELVDELRGFAKRALRGEEIAPEMTQYAREAMAKAQPEARTKDIELARSWIKNAAQTIREVGQDEIDAGCDASAEVYFDQADKAKAVLSALSRLSAKEGQGWREIAEALVNIDWCIGYELTEAQYIELDRIRSKAAAMLAPATSGKPKEGKR